MTKLERLILRSWPLSFFIRKSQTLILPGFQGHTLFDIIHQFLKQIKKIGLYERASAISFNLIMALPAAVLFLFSLIPYFPKPESLRYEILLLFKNITPNKNTYSFIADILDILDHQQVGLFSFGFVLLIFYSSNAMMGVIRTFDKSVQERKAIFLHKRLRAIRLTFILMILVLISSVALFVGKDQMVFLMKNVFHAKKQNMRTFFFWWGWFRWSIIVVLLFYGIGLVYKFAPSVKKRWKLVSIGSLIATLLTLVTTILFSYWVNNFASYNRIYGSIGTVLIIMILVYINALILLIGFEFNVSIMYLTKETEERKASEHLPASKQGSKKAGN